MEIDSQRLTSNYLRQIDAEIARVNDNYSARNLDKHAPYFATAMRLVRGAIQHLEAKAGARIEWIEIKADGGAVPNSYRYSASTTEASFNWTLDHGYSFRVYRCAASKVSGGRGPRAILTIQFASDSNYNGPALMNPSAYHGRSKAHRLAGDVKSARLYDRQRLVCEL